MIKLLYKPFSMLVSMLVSVLGGILAGAIFKRVWKLDLLRRAVGLQPGRSLSDLGHLGERGLVVAGGRGWIRLWQV